MIGNYHSFYQCNLELFLLTCLFYYLLFERHRDREAETEKKKFSNRLSLFQCLPRTGPELKLGAKNTIQASTLIGEPQLLKAALLPPRICIVGKWESGTRAENQTQALQCGLQRLFRGVYLLAYLVLTCCLSAYTLNLRS